jgi:hypothetical protein
MRRRGRILLFLMGAALPLAAQQPAPTPANAVAPSDQSAVAPAFPARAGEPNREVLLGVPTPSATPAGALPGPTPAPVPEVETPTVSSPRFLASPAAGSAHPRAGVVVARPLGFTHGASSTVTDYEKGRSLTVRTPAGSLERYRIAKDTVLPDDLGPGRRVLVETRVVKKRRYASKVTYAEARVVITNVN